MPRWDESRSASILRVALRSRKADLAAVALLVAIACGLVGPALTGVSTQLGLDMLATAEPWKSEIPGLAGVLPVNPEMSDEAWEVLPSTVRVLEAWREGVPLWNPHLMNGAPGLATGKQYTHPILLPLAALLGAILALAWTSFLHLALAGVGLYLLLRELGCRPLAAVVGALSFELNGYLLVWLSIPFLAGVIAWTPWVFWGIERAIRRQRLLPAALGALAFAAQIYSGYILGAYLTAAGAALLFAGRAAGGLRARGLRPVLREVVAPLVLVIGGGAGLAAPLLVPSIELYRQSLRSAPSADVAARPAREALRLVAPHLLGRPLSGDDWRGANAYAEGALYFGVLPLAAFAAAFARRRTSGALGYALLASVPVLGAFGAPLARETLLLVAPMLRGASLPRSFTWAAFAGAVAIGLGAQALLASRSESPDAARARRCGMSALAAVGLLAIVALRQSTPWIVHREQLVATAVLCGLGLALLVLRDRDRFSARLTGCLIAALALADLARAHHGWTGLHRAADAVKSTPSLVALAELASRTDSVPPARILAVHSNSILPGRMPEGYGFFTPSGYSSWVLRRSSAYFDETGDRVRASPNHVYFATCCGPLTDALGVELVLVAHESIGEVDHARAPLARIADAKAEAAYRPGKLLWRFGDVERPVLFEHPPAVLHLPIEPADLALRGELALAPERVSCPSDGVLFSVSATGPDGQSRQLFSRYLDPDHRSEDRGVVPFAVSLQGLAPGTRELLLATDPGPRGDLTCDWAGWVDPRFDRARPDPLERVRDGPNPIYRNHEAFPRAWLVHEVELVTPGDHAAALRRLRARQSGLASVAIVEPAGPTALVAPQARGARESVTWRAAESSRLALDVEASGAALLVISDSFYPGWTATVDGIETPVLAANLAMRGVAIASGRHRVELVYRPASWRIGLAIGGTTALLFAAGALLLRRKPFAAVAP